MANVKTRSKYGAKRTEVDGIVFHSLKEATRYQELRLLERAGEISGLELQPRYELTVQGARIGRYIGDFRYLEWRTGSMRAVLGPRRVVVEDVKGMQTPMYRWKKRHMLAEHGVDIRET